MKIVLCSSGYPPVVRGGGEISSALLARGLTELGIDVTVVTFADAYSRKCCEGVDVLRLPCPNVYWSMQSEQASSVDKARWHLAQSVRPTPPASIRNAIEELQPNLIHTSTIEDFGPSIWRWAAANGIKTVHTLRSYFLLHYKSTLYDPRLDREILPDLLSYPKRRFSRSVDGVVGISKHILQSHQDRGFFPDSASCVIANPSDADIVATIAASEGPIRMGVLGRVSPEKGIGQLIDSLHHLSSPPPWTLDIAGDGQQSLLDDLSRRAGELPIRFRGWCNSREFLSELDMLLVPSRWQEPFGRIVVEAYSLGLPVACLQRGGLQELVQHDLTGWVFDEWTPETLGLAMGKCRQVDRSVIRRIAKRYTVRQIALEYLDFYRTLLGSS